jgi:hypothetical protein
MLFLRKAGERARDIARENGMTAPGEHPGAAVMSRINKISETQAKRNGKAVEERGMTEMKTICEKRQKMCWQTAVIMV